MPIPELTDETFDLVIKTPGIFLVHFTASWGGIYQALTPVLEILIAEGVRVYKADVDKCGVISSRYNVGAIPTSYFFKNGELVKIVPGGWLGKSVLLEAIQTLEL